MGIFDRFRSAGQGADHGKKAADAARLDATRLIDEGHVLEAAGRLDAAMQCYQDAIRLAPNPARAYLNLGNVLVLKGDLSGALNAFRTAIEHQPDYAGAYYNIGNALQGNGQFDEAAASYRSALQIQPDYAEVLCALGVALKELGQLDEAVTCFQKALQVKPDMVEAHINLGHALKALGQLEGAVACYRRAVEIKPDFAEAHYDLGSALKAIGKLDVAVASYYKALEIKPDLVEAHFDLGSALRALGQFEGAVTCYRRALEFKPDLVEVLNNLGLALQDLGKIQGAMECYRRAVEIKPDFTDAHSNLLFTLNYTASHVSSYCLDQARQYGQVVAGKVGTRFSAWQCAARPERLRVGLVSGDLCNHPVGHFLEGLMAHIDPARIELIAYPTPYKEDKLTARIRPYFAAWKPLTGKIDEVAARLIHADGVHVLLDLSGHTAHNRLPVFAWKPAPVQASWLGYFATTGVAEMDYLLVDEVGVPEAQQQQFTESVWYLPDTRLCFTAPRVDLPVAPLPALHNGYVTFGCFQTLAKVGDEVLAAWGQILTALPNAKLRVQCKQLGDAGVAAQFLASLQRQGIDPARVSLHGAVSREAYLAAHAEVDMILDTFPYPGGTTTCEALWMGVPTLTLAGDSLLARQGASLLSAAGLEDWVATSKEKYVAKAIALASDLPRLAALRAGLRQQVLACPLFDAPRFARHLEDALWGMWQRYQAQQANLERL